MYYVRVREKQNIDLTTKEDKRREEKRREKREREEKRR